MPDFWRTSGFHLLKRGEGGWLTVTGDYLRAYLQRPEIYPVEESCDGERALHARLMAEPRCVVLEPDLDGIVDQDTRFNYRLMLAFRERLTGAGTVEGCYIDLFRDGDVDVPPLFIDQMVHAILRNVLDGCEDPLRPRAAELLFRSQKVTLMEGATMMADEETVAMHVETGGLGDLGRLLATSDTPSRSVELDVLGTDNGALYWNRSEQHDTVIDMTFTRPGLDALCRVLETWVGHFLNVLVRIQPVPHIRDPEWTWHVGLDAEASGLLNDLYAGNELEEDRLRRLLTLFRLEFDDPAEMRGDIRGKPVYLGMAMDGANVVRLKPQNLLINLPLAEKA